MRTVSLVAALVAGVILAPAVEAACPPARPRARSMGAKPRILWRADVPSRSVRDGVALAGDRVAISAGHSAFVLDGRGVVVGRYDVPEFLPLAAPVGGPDGRFYVAGQIAVALDRRGKVVWRTPIAEGRPARLVPSPFVLSPEGVLFAAYADSLIALDAGSGKVLWRALLPGGDALGRTAVVAGAGELLVVDTPARGFRLHDRRTGKLMAEVLGGEGAPDPSPLAVAGHWGILAVSLTGTGRQIDSFGGDGKLRWSTVPERHAFPAFVDLKGELLSWEIPGGGERAVPDLRRYGCDGAEGKPLSVGAQQTYLGPFVLGADGVAYTATDAGGLQPSAGEEIVAVDGDMKVAWRLPLIGSEILGAPVLAPRGRLYVVAARARDLAGEVYAVQTGSPGPAKTAWPGARHDARGAGWGEIAAGSLPAPVAPRAGP